MSTEREDIKTLLAYLNMAFHADRKRELMVDDILSSDWLKEHDRKARKSVLKKVDDILDECWPRGQYEHFDDRYLSRHLKELKSDILS